MSQLIKVLHLLDNDNSTIFSGTDAYVVPLYQRAYAWEEKEILQLLHDIYYTEQGDDTHYYLGSLIVDKSGSTYEVIDGQQRLTTLFILVECLHELGIIPNAIPKVLQFSCRDKSNYTLNNIHRLIDDERIEESIRAGKDIVMAELRNLDPEVLASKMKRVVLYRIEVPEKTDLNRYFEIMNTRGEQLEQHDILKATLMSFLSDSKEKSGFAAIWDACSDMTGYVQMHFPKKLRESLFGNDWRSVPKNVPLALLCRDNADAVTRAKISEIIQGDYETAQYDGINDNSDRVRFESIIDFPFFLLHVLKVFAAINNISSSDGILIAELLDDKKLVYTFERVIEKGNMGGLPISAQKDAFSRRFIGCLLLCRFLFDKYIIKREYVNEDSDGKWSMKELHVSGQQSKKKPYYKNTWIARQREQEKTRERRTMRNIMLQSCFRVSYTSPKAMHWITELLICLARNNMEMLNHLDQYETVTEEIAKRAVRKDFLEKCAGTPPVYNMGVETPHIVFNYLDYLLWKDTEPEFVFEFRNSVEHWYPQHPSEGTFEQWTHEEGVDDFGNLCIIQRNVNSRFSNMSPEAKKSTFEDMIRKGSLKLRRMAELTEAVPGKSASENWRRNIYLQHEREMIAMLKLACGLS